MTNEQMTDEEFAKDLEAIIEVFKALEQAFNQWLDCFINEFMPLFNHLAGYVRAKKNVKHLKVYNRNEMNAKLGAYLDRMPT
jgi:hypothetical protein